MRQKKLVRPAALLALLVALIVGVATVCMPAATAATGTVYVRGTVTCSQGQGFVGAYVNSSGGKSGFAAYTILPGTSGRMARFSRTLSGVTLPTTVTLNVGCGGTTSSWRYVFNGVGKVLASGGGTAFINLGCTTSSCSIAPRGTLGGTVNPVPWTGECTWRAAEFWRQMTGRYHPWSGNAGYWDNNAPAYGWQVRGWPEPDSLMIWQPNTGGALSTGHVGYVADLRVSSGRTQVKIYDRNGVPGQYGADRNGVWMYLPAGVTFIRVPPRYTPYNR